jgi:hypothetical protein
MRRLKISLANTLDGIWVGVELAARLGLIGGAAFAAAIGQVLLALILAAIALGLFLRVWRKKAKKLRKG